MYRRSGFTSDSACRHLVNWLVEPSVSYATGPMRVMIAMFATT